MSALRESRRTSNVDLLGVVSELRALRTASQTQRYRGAPPPLPSREIVEAFVSALYPAISDRPILGPTTSESAVGRRLRSAPPPSVRGGSGFRA